MKQKSFLKRLFRFKQPRSPISMRQILNLSLFIFITLIMMFLAAANYLQLSRQNEKLFSIQMVHSAGLVDFLVSLNIKHLSLQQLAMLLNEKQSDRLYQGEIRSIIQPKTQEFYNIYRQAFFFQVYSLQDGHILLKSSNAPDIPLNAPNGFSIFQPIGFGDKWYVFSMNSQYQPVKIIISIKQSFKKQVLMDLFWNFLKELLWLYAILTLVAMLLIRIIFAPLIKITQALKKRDSRNIQPIEAKRIPKEVLPLLNQINRLFVMFNETLQRETRFAGDAAHELKTPLAGIKTQIEVALNMDDIEAMKEKMRLALKSMDRYYHIIEQLLTLTRLEPTEFINTKNELVEINRFAAHWIAEMVPQAMEKNIELSLHRYNKPMKLFASSLSLDILFRNLLDNAIRYTPDNGKIKVIISRENDDICLRFCDNGPGVKPDELTRIFDRFYRQSGTGESGSGLGLSIVKEIVRLHDGKIQAINRKTGGLEVLIRLPICKNNDSM
ncbi:ATP-binding protein [Thiotrichales bacterium 19S11-10]|nr:ATP-binding protein [Thiotrichales bacterium 19S11-10]